MTKPQPKEEVATKRQSTLQQAMRIMTYLRGEGVSGLTREPGTTRIRGVSGIVMWVSNETKYRRRSDIAKAHETVVYIRKTPLTTSMDDMLVTMPLQLYSTLLNAYVTQHPEVLRTEKE